MSNTWIRTDEMQFVKKESKTEFNIIDIVETPNDNYLVNLREIDIEDEKEDYILNVVQGYGYETIEKLQEIYGEDSNQIIAECLAESMQFDEDTIILNDIKEVNNWLIENGCNLQIKRY